MNDALRLGPTPSTGPDTWHLRQPFSLRGVAALLIIIVLLALSGQRTDIARLATTSADAVATLFGADVHTSAGDGFVRIVSGMFPLQLAEVRETQRIENFNRDALPWGAHLEVRTTTTTNIDPRTLEMRTEAARTEVLVEPLGYLWQVIRLMIETVEIAAWGTIIALLIAAPLAYFGARNYAPHVAVLMVVRGLASLLRATPELISALLLVLIFGFGPLAGVVALGLHTAGFLGKFFAEDIENVDRAPQDALRALGANKLKVLRFAVLPQVLPSYLAYLQYILERNIRTATVIGVVGAGGIGQELKGRFEMFDFAHVGTILAVIFVTVLVLEYLTGRSRSRIL